MTYRQRAHQLDKVECFLDDLERSDKVVVPRDVMEELRAMLGRELEWLKASRPRACSMQEGGIYSFPVRYIGGMSNLQFEDPDGNRMLLPPGIEKYFAVVSLPPPVEKQKEMIL